MQQNTGEMIKGRGAQFNPRNRFLSQEQVQEHTEGIDDWEYENRQTQFIDDKSRTIVNEVKSPDVGMLFSLNPYQGCEHGCIYCYARNTHEYWGYSAGIDFESRIIVKQDAPQLLRNFFLNKNWKPAPISLSGNTDCYQPVERKMKLTRQLLEICLEFRNPVGIITKNALILRDIDLLQELASKNLVCVYTSITGTDEKLRLLLEPRTSTYKSRFQLVESLSHKGIPTGIMNAPLIPGLNDMQMHDVLQTAASAGAKWAGYTIIRLNGKVEMLFKDWLFTCFPERGPKIWNQVKSCHGGQVNDSRFKTRMQGEGPFAHIIRQQFKLFCRKFHLNETSFEYNIADFRRIKKGMPELF